MKRATECRHWLVYVTVGLTALALITLVAFTTRLWALTAVPIGFLFGFFLQKGDLCAASTFSEVLIMKDWRKVFAIWVAIVVSMVGFAVLDVLGWVKLNPKPMLWLGSIVGGAVFGVGMVLAGGCVSGCLFKAGTGNLNSMASLVGIPLGAALVRTGPLSSLNAYMRTFIIKAHDGGPVTLSSLTGLPFGVLALGFAVLTLILAAVFRHRRRAKGRAVSSDVPLRQRILTRSWRPWQAGLAIGILTVPAYLSSVAIGRNYPLCVRQGVTLVQQMITDASLTSVSHKKSNTKKVKGGPPSGQAMASAKKKAREGLRKRVMWWSVGLVSALVVGSWVSGRLSGEARLLPKPPEQVIVAFFGGILVGTGATLAIGCFVGNVLSGWALMSIGGVLFAIAMVLANWVTTYFYLMGGTLFDFD